MATQLIMRDEAVELLPCGTKIRWRINCTQCGEHLSGVIDRNARMIIEPHCDKCGRDTIVLTNQFYIGGE